MDGRTGYLSVPWDPAFSPRELTIAAWVRAEGDGCQTLASNDRTTSWSVALCDVVRFSVGGHDAPLTGATVVGSGWHHVAVTADRRGRRTIYVDGRLDNRDTVSEKYPTSHERIGLGRHGLRIGGDAGSVGDRLHGFVRGLAVFRRVLTLAAVRRLAFHEPTRGRGGLVAFWPLNRGLDDVTGAHDAGIVGSAALAVARPPTSPFPREPRPRRRIRPSRQPGLTAWDGRVPLVTTAPRLDGLCESQYDDAADARLEPTRIFDVKLARVGDDLWVCVNPLFGRPTRRQGLTVALAGESDGPALTASITGDGRIIADPGIDGRAFHGPRLPGVDDSPTVRSPWFAGELRISLARLGNPGAGAPARLTLSYRGHVAAHALVDARRTRLLDHGKWPSRFDARRRATWGHIVLGAPTLATRADEATTAKHVPPARAASPSGFDHLLACPYTNAWAWFFGPPYLKWPPVTGSSAGLPGPFQRASGTLTEVDVSNEDAWPLHSSHDVDSVATASTATDRELNVDGGPRLVFETESAGFPPNGDSQAQARPSPGDHASAMGRYIFDCGHDRHTELHPTFAYESDRDSLQPVHPGGPLRHVRLARVWFNSFPGRFAALPLFHYPFAGSFDFDLSLPTPAWGRMPFLSVLSGDPARVQLTGVSGGLAHVRVSPPVLGSALFELALGYLDTPEDSVTTIAGGYTMTLDSIDITHDKDSGLRGKTGEWYLSINANGVWRQILWDTSVYDGVDTPGYPLNGGCALGVCLSIPPIALTGSKLHVEASGYEDDSPSSDPVVCTISGLFACFTDDSIDGGPFDLGSLAGLVGGERQLHTGDWTIYYHLSKGGPRSVLGDDAFWGPRLADEPNDGDAGFCNPYACPPTSLGPPLIHVPAVNGPITEVSHNGFITERPLTHSGTRLRDQADVDSYSFRLDDFADVAFFRLPASLAPPATSLTKSWPGYFPNSVPSCLSSVLGYAGGLIKIRSLSGATGDVPYSLRMQVRYRSLPPDWGERQDGAADSSKPGTDPCTPTRPATSTPGRPTDLTRDPTVEATAPADVDPLGGDDRILTMPWAWQDRPGDTDLYDIHVPPPTPAPAGHKPCPYDVSTTRLEIDAPAMNLQVVGGPAGDGEVSFDDLEASHPDHDVRVIVKNPTGHRGIYRLSAAWGDTRWQTVKECNALKAIFAPIPVIVWPVPIDDIIHVPHGPSDPPGDPELRFGPLGGFVGLTVNGPDLATIISAPEPSPVDARLFDPIGPGVLRAEGTSSAATTTTTARIPDGLLPSSTLAAGGLRRSHTYLLQVVPLPAGTQSGTTTKGHIGLSAL